MINRVLIRIKVIQLLYSYLLVEDQFSLESPALAPTKEKRFAYNLYMDILELMAGIAASLSIRGGGKPLAETRFMRRVMNDEKIRSLHSKYQSEGYPFEKIEGILIDRIRESGLFKQFVKDGGARNIQDENVLKNIFDMIIMTAPELTSMLPERENYSLKGVDRMRAMMDETFKNFFSSAEHLPDALKTLKNSLDKARELYFRLLLLPVAITELREREIEDARFKHLKREEDINPNLRFVENDLIKHIRNNEQVRAFQEKYKIDWLRDDDILIRQLLKAIMESDLYKEYMEFPATDNYTDCEFWRKALKYIVFVNEHFLESLEDKSVFWNDDIDVIGTFVLKSIRRFANIGKENISEEDSEPIMSMYKDEEDAKFGEELFADVAGDKDYYRDLISQSLDRANWDFDRMAYMDVVIIMTALAEILNFPKIPLIVSVNEYIEIAKYYSTPKSGPFINGLLGDIIAKLQHEGVLKKKF